MNKYFPSFLIVLLLFVFAACNSVEEQVLINDSVELVETHIDNTTQELQQPVVFQMSIETDDELTGYIITKTGQLLGYDASELNTDDLPFNDAPSIHQLNNLVSNGHDMDFYVDMEDLLEKADLIANAAEGRINEAEMDYEEDMTIVFYAYKVTTENHYGGSSSEEHVCDDCGTNSSNVMPVASSHTYERVLLESQGIINQNNESEAAQQLTEWLNVELFVEFFKGE